MDTTQNQRILLIDDMPAIHEDFRKILAPQVLGSAEFSAIEAELFCDKPVSPVSVFELDSAYQGQEGLAKVQSSLETRLPYAMAFVDMRMPPGWDGVETIRQLWQVDPRLQIVICTAFSDHSLDKICEQLDAGDRLLILKKPFDPVEVRQLANTLTAKWQMTENAALKMEHLEEEVVLRTRELQEANAVLQEDIVVRIRNEADLRLAASVFHNTRDGVMIVDPKGQILSLNPAFMALTGYRPEQLVGQPMSLVYCERQGPEFYSEMWCTLEKNGHWEGELWNRRQDGKVFLAWLSMVAVVGNEGSPERYVSVFHDITEIRRKEKHIEYLAFHDALTGLPNRALLQDRLGQAITQAKREQVSLGIMFIDLDRFKAINDSFGHDVGNDLLKKVADLLKKCLRASDIVARMGGDEFVVVLKCGETPPNYGVVAQKIIDTLSMPIMLNSYEIRVGTSIGIACFPADGNNTTALMKHADAAMYAAKGAGRGTYRFFQPEMSDMVFQRLQFEMQLRHGISNGELELFYQPKLLLRTGTVCGVEALVRWHHPVHGLLPPNDFIPLAESNGLIENLGDWVIQEACRQLQEWQRKGLRMKIAVNVSARQLQQRDFVERIVYLTHHYHISPSDLEIEITESVLMSNPEQVSEALSSLRQIGILVAVDDFGTGYSSLAYLRHLPVDILKIDRSFVKNAAYEESDAQIVKLIIALGHALKLEIVAEGVETESQAEFLRACGCESAQGYLYSRPYPSAEIEPWLREHCDAPHS